MDRQKDKQMVVIAIYSHFPFREGYSFHYDIVSGLNKSTQIAQKSTKTCNNNI